MDYKILGVDIFHKYMNVYQNFLAMYFVIKQKEKDTFKSYAFKEIYMTVVQYVSLG